ncbi:diguanylate cyclase [Edwardsiella hoshinae]|uniref:diguanylate cyclase n=1 Tax=Edwardsiella hoshinae TaxID=93378 RepID=A0ABM6EGX6_9GAMM|nr:GGDEF domain-containing protein [Edwardsiella hoshinae]AOV96143.1 diguanylate cyclase [Edwardsiella hoshinae]
MEGKAPRVSRCGGPLGVSLLSLTIISYILILYAAEYPITLLYGFVAVCNAVLLILHLLIAIFIFMQFNCDRTQVYKLPLIAAYILSALILSYSLLFYPDVFQSRNSHALTLNDFVLFYLLRYGGMGMLFLYALYLFVRGRTGLGGHRSVPAICAAIVSLVTLSALLLSSRTAWPNPAILQESLSYHADYRYLLLPTMGALWAGVALLLIWQTRLATHFWLAVTLACLAIVGGFLLQWRAPHVNSVGWYGSLLFGLLANFCVMAIFLYDIFQRYRCMQHAYVITHDNAIRDGLTRAYNRSYYYDALHHALPQASAERPLAILIIDIDHFKQVNDRYGHLSGDRALIAVSDVIEQSLSAGDVLARIGGDELCVLLLAVENEAGLYRLAEQIREQVAALAFRAQDGQPVALTLSIGGVVCRTARQSAEGYMVQADSALYQAKQTGRNRVVLAPGTS